MAAPGRLQRIVARFSRADMPDDERWSIDDMAECLIQGPWVNVDGTVIEDPGQGYVAIVRDVDTSRGRDRQLRQYLVFARWPTKSFDARYFRKLTPRADVAQAADATFLRQLQRGNAPAPSLAQRIAARLERILS